MKKEIMDQLHRYFEENPSFMGSPASPEEIHAAQVALGLKFNKDYVEFVQHFGGALVGIDVHAFRNAPLVGRSTVIELTQWFHEHLALHGESMDGYYAFSDDGAGNFIIMNEEGNIAIYYHDSQEWELMYGSFEEMLVETLTWWTPPN